VFFSRELDGWVLTRYADCLEVLRDRDRFASDPALARGRLGAHARALRSGSPLGRAPAFAQTDPPVHPRLRAIVNRAFTPRIVESHRPRVAAEVERLLADIEPGEPFYFMRLIAEALPVLVIGDLLGLDDENRLAFAASARAVMRVHTGAAESRADRREAERAMHWLQALLADYARAAPADTGQRLIALVLDAEAEGGRLTAEELLAFVVFVYTAGSAPTAGLLGNGLAALLRHPDQLALLRAEPDRIADATDELLRFDGPTQALARVATADTDIDRRRIAAGDALFVMVGAANRDPAAFPDPDRFDVTREGAHRHLSYGYGAHFCLGAPLARLEAEELLRVLFARFETLDAVPGGFAWGGTLVLRAPRTLQVVAH